MTDTRYVVRFDYDSRRFLVWDQYSGAPSGRARYTDADEATEAAKNLEVTRVS
jgi:hypothetical protein